MRRLCLLFVTLLVISCSSDDSSETPNATPKELLISSSPWQFSEYRIDEVINTDGVLVTDDDLAFESARQNGINFGLNIIFQTDGTGTSVVNLIETSRFDWTLNQNNVLTLTYEEGSPESFNVSALTQTELVLSFDDEFEVSLDDQTIRGVDIRASTTFNSTQ